MTALKRVGSGPPDLDMSRERTDSHTRVWRGTLEGGRREGGERGGREGERKGEGGRGGGRREEEREVGRERQGECKLITDSQLCFDAQSYKT